MNKFFTLILFLSFAAISYAQTIIKLEKENGVYYVPCKVNDLKLKFIFDTGAGDVTISLTEAKFMLKNGYLNNDDILENEKYEIANGDIVEGTKIILRKIQIGNLLLENVEASVVHTSTAPLLLGQSALEKLGDIKIDYANQQLIINPDKKIVLDNYNDDSLEFIPPVDGIVVDDYISEDSLKKLIYKAENGDTSVQLFLSKSYYLGDKLEIDLKNAFYWIEKAAKLGNLKAMVIIGIFYENGESVAQDYNKAKFWYEKAALLGDKNGMYNLGLLYNEGLGVVKDYKSAKYWYEKAASLKHEDAMFTLGTMYDDGKGVTKDYTKAKFWYEKAAILGQSDAMNNLGLLYQYGQGVVEDCLKAEDLFKNSAKLNNQYGMYNLAKLYKPEDFWQYKAEEDNSRPKCDIVLDINKSIYWYQKAASLGNVASIYDLGWIYEYQERYIDARFYYERAAKLNYADAMEKLGNLYQYGTGVEKDFKKAEYWYEKAIENGSVNSSSNLISVQNSLYGVIDGVNMKTRRDILKEYSILDYQNGWIYLSKTKNDIKLFKDVSKDGYNIKVWIKSIPAKGQLANYRGENAASFKSTTTKQKIATQLSAYKSLCIINCKENKLGEKSSVYYSKDGNVIHSDDDEFFNVYDMPEVVPDSIGEDILKTICEYYEKYGK